MSDTSVSADKREGKLNRLLALQDLQPFNPENHADRTRMSSVPTEQSPKGADKARD
jgi:hypothetical protein